MNKKAIFEYCGCEFTKFDSNDMIFARDKIVQNDDWLAFFEWVYQKEEPPLRVSYFITWLMQPDRFFDLMSEALEKGVIGK